MLLTLAAFFMIESTPLKYIIFAGRSTQISYLDTHYQPICTVKLYLGNYLKYFKHILLFPYLLKIFHSLMTFHPFFHFPLLIITIRFSMLRARWFAMFISQIISNRYCHNKSDYYFIIPIDLGPKI